MNKLLFSLLLLLIGQFGVSQSNGVPEATNCYFIKNAEVVVRPGQVLSGTSIVIRGGLITDVGKSIKAPYDAKVIEADSLYVYAGFIDPLSHTGLKEEDKEDKSKENKPSSPGVATFSQAGITPQTQASDNLSLKDKSINSMRDAGFVISHVVPKGYILPGQGSIISLKEATSEEDLILRKDISMLGQLKTKRGVFPSTLIGAMSRLREIKKNTDIYTKNMMAYKSNPLGMSRPAYVGEYDAFSGVNNKTKPLFFVAQKPKEIHRAITLQKEMGFDMVISDAKLITPVLDFLGTNTPILLSLDLPKEIKEEDKKEEEKVDKKPEDKKKKEEKKELTQEQKDLTAKKKASYDQYMQQAKMLAERNVPFSYSYLDINTSNIVKSIRRLIAAGLPEDKALAGLTTNAASILNISNICGTIEKGKLGSLVITDKPLFDEKSKIRYVIVEGQVNEMKKEDKSKKTKGSDEDLGDLSGTWRYEIVIEGETQYGNIYLTKDGESYTIGAESDDEPGEVDKAYNIAVNDNNITFSLDVDNDGTPLVVNLDINFINANRFEGQASIDQVGTYPITADKRDTPD